MKRLLALLAIFVVGATATACRPGTTPGTPESIYTHQDTWQAIEDTFGPFGPTVVACAHAIVDRESGHWPYSISPGGRYLGAWQEHAGFEGTIANYGAAYGFLFASRMDPYLATWAARDAFVAAGGSFRRNWPTTPGGCP